MGTVPNLSAFLRRYDTIQEYAETLIQLVHYRDDDGRDIGYDYGYIRDAILRKFPTVKLRGPHLGKQTRMPYKELWEISCELNRKGVKLPFRPRRKNQKHSAKNKSGR
jgi:hypothetical protein